MGSTQSYRPAVSLSGLPASVRNRIYPVTDVGVFGTHVELNHRQSFLKSTIPPIMQSCQLLRAETIVPYYSTSKFHMRIDLAEETTPEQTIAQIPTSWLKKVAVKHVKHIRGLTLSFEAPGLRYVVILRLDSENNLVVCTSPGAPQRLRQRLSKHVSRTEASGEALSMQGETIVLALLTEPELWTHGSLMGA